MIPIRCKTVSGVALSTIDGETKLLVMKRVKGGFWCHVAGTVEAGKPAGRPLFANLARRRVSEFASYTQPIIWNNFTKAFQIRWR